MKKWIVNQWRKVVKWVKDIVARRSEKRIIKNLQSALVEKELEKSTVKRKVFRWLYKKNKAVRMTDFHNQKLAAEKFSQELKDAGIENLKVEGGKLSMN